MFSLSSNTVKILQTGLFFIESAVMWALEYLGMTIYIYTSIAFQSAVRQIYINYILEAYVAPILASKKISSDYVAYENIMPTF